MITGTGKDFCVGKTDLSPSSTDNDAIIAYTDRPVSPMYMLVPGYSVLRQGTFEGS